MDIRLLGPLEVVDGDRVVGLPGGRARSLLALLALHPGRVLSTDRLIDELWGRSPPPTVATALQGHVSTLRRLLEPHRAPGAEPTVILTHPPGYVLAVGPDQVDAGRFRRWVETAPGSLAEERAATLRAALSLWRGPALADFVYEPFAQTAITALEELRLVALETRIGADLELGRHTTVVVELEELALQHPLREQLRAHLMLALYRCGRQADALEVFRNTRRHLLGELGIEPGPRLRAMHRAILAHDPSLAPPEATHTGSSGLRNEPDEGDARWLPLDRRTVTVVVTNFSVATPDGDLDPEVVGPALERALAAIRSVVAEHGGTVEGVVGDHAVAVFGLPVAHEDDAVRAVRAGVAIRQRVGDGTGTPREPTVAARVGISTGEIVVGGGDDPRAGVSGPPVVNATRLQQRTANGDVLLDDPTRRLVQRIAFVEPCESSTEGPDAWRVVDVVPPPRGFVTGDTPHVGRAEELAALREALDRVTAGRRPVLVTVIGEAGIGKSRLARAFVEEVSDDVRMTVGRCRAYGEGITFWPLREVLEDLRGDGDLSDLIPDDDQAETDAALVAAAVGLTDGRVRRPAELFAAVRRLLERLARQGILVLVLEDVHWAEPTLLDLVEYLAERTSGPVLFACLARPEFLERRPRWADAVTDADSIRLQPLSAPESRELLTDHLGGRLLAPETMGEILAMAQGNPLFLEQLLAAVREDDELAIPPTLQALLTARLDRLGPAERDVVRAASVIGIDVRTAALTALLPDEARPYLHRHLQALEDKDLIRGWSESADGSGADFSHVLIQQAAYRSLTHEARGHLHERLANHLLSGAGRKIEDLVGHHLEQAFLHRRRLGRSDAETTGLGVRAGERLAASGLRAYERFDVAAAENLLSRARALLPEEHPDRRAVLRRLSEAYPIMGRPEDAANVFDELLAAAERAGDDDALRLIRLEQTRFRLILGPDPVALDTIRQEVEDSLQQFHRSGDAVGVSQASYVLASVHLRAGRISELEAIGWRGIERARRTGDLRERLGAPWWVVFAMLEGPTPVPACIRACEEVLEVGDLSHLGVLAALGHFRAMLGEIEEGRRLVIRARELLRERIRVPRPLEFLAQQRAGVERLAGDAHAAERALREGLDVAMRVSERDSIARIAGPLAVLLAERGELDEANRIAGLAENRAPAESVTARALAGVGVARVSLARGDADEAERQAQSALASVPSDMLELQAWLNLQLHAILDATDRPSDAASAAERAHELYERKGNVVAARHVGVRVRRS